MEGNAARGKLWNAHAPYEMNPANYINVSDSFMMNMGAVLLKLCMPFCGNTSNGKVLKVDPTYCAIEVSRSYDIGASSRCI